MGEGFRARGAHGRVQHHGHGSRRERLAATGSVTHPAPVGVSLGVAGSSQPAHGRDRQHHRDRQRCDRPPVPHPRHPRRVGAPPAPMDITWSGANGQKLQLFGTSFVSRVDTSAAQGLSLTIQGPEGVLEFTSTQGECSITITPALPDNMGGRFSLHRVRGRRRLDHGRRAGNVRRHRVGVGRADREAGPRLARRPGAPTAGGVPLAVRRGRLPVRRRSRRAGLPLVDPRRRERRDVGDREPARRACARGGAGRDAPAERRGGDRGPLGGARGRGRRGRRAGPRRRRPRRPRLGARRAAGGGVLRAHRGRVPRQPRPGRVLPRGGRRARGCASHLVGGGAAPRGRRDRPSPIPGARDRRAARGRDPRLACGGPRRGPGHRAVGHGGGLVAGAGVLATIAGSGPIAAETSKDGYLRRAGLDDALVDAYRELPAPRRAIRPVDRRSPLDPRHARRRRVPASFPRPLARGDGRGDPARLDRRMVPAGQDRHVRVRGPDRRGDRPGVDPPATHEPPLGDSRGRRRSPAG